MSFLDRIKGPKGSPGTAGAAADGDERSGPLAMSSLPHAEYKPRASSALTPMAPADFDELVPPSAMEVTIRLEPGLNDVTRAAHTHVAPIPYLAPPPTPQPTALPAGVHPTPTAPGSAAAPLSSIIAEASPSELATEFNESTTSPKTATPFDAASGLPLVGGWTLARQQRTMLVLLGLGLLGLVAAAVWALGQAAQGAEQVAAAGQAGTQSQRLAKSATQAGLGHPLAFPEVTESVSVLTRNLRGLQTGDGALQPVPAALQPALAALMPLVDRAEKSAALVVAQEKTLTQTGKALRAINRQSAELLETAEAVAALKQQAGVTMVELVAVNQLAMLSQRVGKSANEFVSAEGASAEAVFLLEKDLGSFKDTTQALLEGRPDVNLPGTRDGPAREKLQLLQTQFETTRSEARAILDNLTGLVSAREAQATIIANTTGQPAMPLLLAKPCCRPSRPRRMGSESAVMVAWASRAETKPFRLSRKARASDRVVSNWACSS